MHAEFNMRIAILISLLAVPVIALAQAEGGSIRGTITGPQNERVPYRWVRAKRSADQAEVARSESAEDGTYLVSDLPPGDYIVEVGGTCCAYVWYERDGVTVERDKSTELDIALEEGDSFNTVGDDPGVIAGAIRSETIIPDEPVPSLPGGKPDFSGVWILGLDPFPDEPVAHEWAQKLFDERVENFGRDHPHNECLPGDPPIAFATPPFFTKFVHKDELLVQLLEDYPGFRQIFVDGRDHPDYIDPSWLGYSVAKWEGDVLVVETIGYNDRGWLYLWPRSEELRVTERYTRIDYGRISLDITYEDSKVFEKPWSQRRTLYLAPQEELIEYVCENNKW